MMYTIEQAWIAALIVIVGAAFAVGAIALFLAGLVWVLDGIAERFGEYVLDVGGQIFTIIAILVVLGVCWLGTFYWLMGWS